MRDGRRKRPRARRSEQPHAVAPSDGRRDGLFRGFHYSSSGDRGDDDAIELNRARTAYAGPDPGSPGGGARAIGAGGADQGAAEERLIRNVVRRARERASGDLLVLPAEGAHIAKKSKPQPVLVATATASASGAGTVTPVLKLTSKGKKLLAHASSIRLTALGTFTPSGGAAIAVQKTFTLKR